MQCCLSRLCPHRSLSPGPMSRPHSSPCPPSSPVSPLLPPHLLSLCVAWSQVPVTILFTTASVRLSLSLSSTTTSRLHLDRSTTSPVVFCHGLLGFDSVTIGPAIAPLQVAHWRGIKQALEQNGTRVLITRVPATSSYVDRAKALEERISQEYPGKSVHLIGILLVHFSASIPQPSSRSQHGTCPIALSVFCHMFNRLGWPRLSISHNPSDSAQIQHPQHNNNSHPTPRLLLRRSFPRYRRSRPSVLRPVPSRPFAQRWRRWQSI